MNDISNATFITNTLENMKKIAISGRAIGTTTITTITTGITYDQHDKSHVHSPFVWIVPFDKSYSKCKPCSLLLGNEKKATLLLWF